MKNSKIWKSFTFILIIGFLIASSNYQTGYAYSTAMELTVEGSVTGTLTEAEIKFGLPTATGYGGFQRIKEPYTIDHPSKWKGVHLPLFLSSIVGVLDYNVSIIALDSWHIDLTRLEVEGAMRTFDEENNTLSIKPIPVLAYEQNDSSISDDDGPLRLVFIGDNNQSILTLSPLWVKNVITLQVTLETDETFTLTSISVPDTNTASSNSFGVSILFFIISTILIVRLRRKRNQY